MIDGVPFYLEERRENDLAAGSAANLPLLAVHGYGVDHGLMAGCLEPVFAAMNPAQRPSRRIYLDLAGMGRSPRHPDIRTADDYLAWLQRAADLLLPNGQYLLAGYSYGGYLAQGLRYRNADRVAGLLLICPVSTAQLYARRLPSSGHVFRDDDWWQRQKDEPDAADFARFAAWATEEGYDRFRQHIAPGLARGNRDFMTSYRGSADYDFSFEEELHRAICDVPSCILLGRQDRIVGYEDMLALRDRFSHGTMTVFDGAGHNLQIDRIGLFEAMVKDWMERLAVVTV